MHLREQLVPPSQTGRLFHFDALRGLAAVVVLFHHFHLAITTKPVPFYLRPFTAGESAVVLFFVLSGYVLSLPYWKAKQLPYKKYIVRRAFRIYAPYAVAVCVAVLVGGRLLFSHLPLTPWFNHTWQSALTPSMILSQFVCKNSGAVNTAFWSLRYEMEMSIIFPFVCYILGMMPSRFAWPLVLLCEYSAVHLYRAFAGEVHKELAFMLLWATAFMCGALLAREQKAIAEIYRRLGMPLKLLAFGFVVAGYYSKDQLFIIPAACGVIVFADCSRARGWLSTRLPIYLGKVSYSLYLIHGTVLFATFILMYGKYPLWMIGTVYLIASFGAAHLFCNLVELPTMALGKRLTTDDVRLEAPMRGIPVAMLFLSLPLLLPLSVLPTRTEKASSQPKTANLAAALEKPLYLVSAPVTLSRP